MSDRERWIIYPLLFLALGASLRDKLFDQTRSKKIVCEELIVIGDDRGHGQPHVLARIGAAEGAPSGAPNSGHMIVDGLLVVEQLRTGTLAANNILYRNVPFTPTWRAILPGVSPTDMLRALQQSAEQWRRQSGASTPKSPPEAAQNKAPGSGGEQ